MVTGLQGGNPGGCIWGANSTPEWSPWVSRSYELSEAIPIGFEFDFFGERYSEIYAGSNGFLTFLSDSTDGCCEGTPIPSFLEPNGLIAGWWADLNPEAGGGFQHGWVCDQRADTTGHG